jgi:carbon storage regulator
MLVLSRKKNESIVINGDVTVTVIDIRGDKVRLGIVCPKDCPVHRQEVYDAIHDPLVDRPLLVNWPALEDYPAREPTHFIEISLGQLLAEVGAKESQVDEDAHFDSEGGISR